VFAFSPKQVARYYKMHEVLAAERVIELAYLPTEVDENLCDGYSFAQLINMFKHKNQGDMTYADEGADDLTSKSTRKAN